MQTPHPPRSTPGLLLMALLLAGPWPAGSAAAVAAEGGRVRVVVAGLTHAHVHWILGRAAGGDIEIVGIAEANRDLARRYTERHGLSMDLVQDDLETLLDRARPDAVTAFGTIREHFEVVEACADPFAYLAAVVRGEVAPAPDDLSSLELNLVVMEFLDAAMTSARTGRRVGLAPDPP